MDLIVIGKDKIIELDMKLVCPGCGLYTGKKMIKCLSCGYGIKIKPNDQPGGKTASPSPSQEWIDKANASNKRLMDKYSASPSISPHK